MIFLSNKVLVKGCQDEIASSCFGFWRIINNQNGVIGMRRCFTYKDDKSDKFWWINYCGPQFAVNFGKTGTTGRFEIKEFDSDEECEKQAAKLLVQKVKKGYIETSDFDFDKHFYLDNEEFGPHILTSHPKFAAHFQDDLYYDCGDEEAPFGSDEGSDTLHFLSDQVRKKGEIDFVNFPKWLIETEWEMTYIPVQSLQESAIQKLIEMDEMNLIQSDMVTYAAGFGQIKITGRIDAALKEAAILAMQRLQIVAKLLKWGDPSEISNQMIAELQSFDC